MKQQFVSFDWVIKYMLRDKTNYVIVEGFLSELLKQSIQIIEVIESESNKNTPDDKYNRVDVLVRNQNDELIIIELQYEAEIDYFQRILYGTSKLITEHIKKGEAYACVRKVISVSLVYFDLGLGDDYLYHGTTIFKGIRKGDTLQLSKKQQRFYQCEQIADIYPEYYLIKIKTFSGKIEDKLDEWIYFFKNENILESFTAQGLHEALAKLDVLKMPEKERRSYENYMENLRYKRSMEETQRWEGYLEGEAEGYQRGKKAEQLQFARNLLNSTDFDDQSISKLTELAIDVIRKLREEKSG